MALLALSKLVEFDKRERWTGPNMISQDTEKQNHIKRCPGCSGELGEPGAIGS